MNSMLRTAAAGLVLFAATASAALAILPKEMTLSYGGPINDGVRWISAEECA